MENTTYYIADNFNGVTFKSMNDLEKYSTKRMKYFLVKKATIVKKYTYLPKGVQLITDI